MAPPVLEKPPTKQIHLIVETGKGPGPHGPVRLRKLTPAEAELGTDFSVALIEANRMPSSPRVWRVATSVLLHTIALGVPLLLGLWFTDTLDIRAYTMTLLAAPPPPPAPPPPAAATAIKPAKIPRRVFSSAGKLLAPTVIPKEIAALHEEPLPPEAEIEGIVGGVPGGVPGGQLGGVIGGIIGGMPSTMSKAIAPPQAAPKKPIRVGGRVKPPREIVKTTPVYPVLARQARIEGEVVLDAVIDTEGNVVNVTVVSGHPLLIEAAINCVRQWKYEPTYLNEQPISVQLIVKVSFQLR